MTRFALYFALITAYRYTCSKTKPLEKPVLKRLTWWRWGRVELPVQTNPSENVLQAYSMFFLTLRTPIDRIRQRLSSGLNRRLEGGPRHSIPCCQRPTPAP